MKSFFFLYNQASIILYLFNHKLYDNLSIYYDDFNIFKLVSLLLIGIFTSLSPCFISLLPVMISSSKVLKYGTNIKIMTLLGLMSSIIITIYFLYIGNGHLRYIFNNIPFISSIIYISIALNLLGILQISFGFNNRLLPSYMINNIYIQPYILGFSIGITSLSCNSSLILTTVLWLYNSNLTIQSLIYLLIYMLGCLLPFSIILLVPARWLKFHLWIHLWEILIPFAGCCFLIFGVFSFFQEIF